GHVDILIHRERRRARFVENPNFTRGHFHFAGGHVGIYVLRVALFDRPLYPDDIFGADLFGTLMHPRIDIFVEGDLGMAGAVAHVDENDTAVIAAFWGPAHQQNALSRVFGAQFAAGMGAAKVAEKVECYGSFHKRAISYQLLAISLQSLGDFGWGQIELLTGRHVLERKAPGGYFIVADEQRVASSHFIGNLYGALRLSFADFHAVTRQAKVARHLRTMAECGLADRHDE